MMGLGSQHTALLCVLEHITSPLWAPGSHWSERWACGPVWLASSAQTLAFHTLLGSRG